MPRAGTHSITTLHPTGRNLRIRFRFTPGTEPSMCGPIEDFDPGSADEVEFLTADGLGFPLPRHAVAWSRAYLARHEAVAVQTARYDNLVACEHAAEARAENRRWRGVYS